MIRIIIAAFLSLVFSINDFAWPYECNQMYDIVETEVDQDGNALYSIFVNKFDGSDSNCLQFGRCIYKLIGSASGMAAVNIINFDDYWVPSKWQWIDSTRAAVLAEEIDLEEYAWLSSYVWEVDHDD
jgi:hypothetical protein